MSLLIFSCVRYKPWLNRTCVFHIYNKKWILHYLSEQLIGDWSCLCRCGPFHMSHSFVHSFSYTTWLHFLYVITLVAAWYCYVFVNSSVNEKQLLIFILSYETLPFIKTINSWLLLIGQKPTHIYFFPDV